MTLVHELFDTPSYIIRRLNFSLYLNHSKIHRRELSQIDILLMNAVVHTRNMGHKGSCLNILGRVPKRKGLKSNALGYFIRD